MILKGNIEELFLILTVYIMKSETNRLDKHDSPTI